MDAESLRRLRESESQAQAHEASKTAHYARLGSAFAKGGSALVTASAPRARPSETSASLSTAANQVRAMESTSVPVPVVVSTTSHNSENMNTFNGALHTEPLHSQRNSDENVTRVSFANDVKDGPKSNSAATTQSVAGSTHSSCASSSVHATAAPAPVYSQSALKPTPVATEATSATSSVLPAARPVSKGLSFLKAPRQAAADPTKVSSVAVPASQVRNNEHFKKIAEVYYICDVRQLQYA